MLRNPFARNSYLIRHNLFYFFVVMMLLIKPIDFTHATPSPHFSCDYFKGIATEHHAGCRKTLMYRGYSLMLDTQGHLFLYTARTHNIAENLILVASNILNVVSNGPNIYALRRAHPHASESMDGQLIVWAFETSETFSEWLIKDEFVFSSDCHDPSCLVHQEIPFLNNREFTLKPVMVIDKDNIGNIRRLSLGLTAG